MQKSFGIMVPIANLNTHLRVNVINGDQHKFGSDINILIENISESPIYFSTDPKTLFVKIFVVENNEWVAIENKATYFSIKGGDGYVLFPDNPDQSHQFTTWVRPMREPNAQDETKQEIVRILVVGELMSAGEKTGIPVGSYVDLFMES